jgi:hypothetical protein
MAWNSAIRGYACFRLIAAVQISRLGDRTVPTAAGRNFRGSAAGISVEQSWGGACSLATGRPMPTLGISPDSGGNVPVTGRSAGNRVEGQLANQVNSRYRPFDGSRESWKQPLPNLYGLISRVERTDEDLVREGAPLQRCWIFRTQVKSIRFRRARM